MTLRRLGLFWTIQMILLGIEVGAVAWLPARLAAVIVLLAMAGMLALVLLVFMRLRAASSLAQAFVAGGLLWLGILLGLGSMDPLTRTDTPTPVLPSR